jgi:hypothetical protein
MNTKPNNLAETHPELLSQWDYDKNAIQPESVTAGSHKKVWWKCSVASDHRWEAWIQNRVRGATCPCCCNRKTVPSNCLSTTHPHLASQWSCKNEIKPTDITAGYNKKAWWMCNKGHTWQSAVNSRTRDGDGCPFCSGLKATPKNNLAVRFPKITKEWDHNKNNLSPDQLLPNSMKRVWWKCEKSKEHSWQTTPNNRVSKNHPCPYCAGKKADSTTSLLAKYPNICKEWDYEKNSIKPEDLLPYSHKKVWWVCNKNQTHRWLASPLNRTGKNKTRCPYCYSSSGEKLIHNYLLQTTTTFSREHRISKCRNKKPLPFDFAILEPCLGLIEFQGKQHYEMIEMYDGEEGYQKRILHDQIKRDYCKANNIPLLEVRYDQTQDIPTLLDDFISSLKN